MQLGSDMSSILHADLARIVFNPEAFFRACMYRRIPTRIAFLVVPSEMKIRHACAGRCCGGRGGPRRRQRRHR